MRLPAYWWLLVLVVGGQGFFLIRFCVLRGLGKGVQPLSRPASGLLALSGLAGLAYGVVQRDPLFVVGQACLLILYYLVQTRSDERKN
ncbi:hypothetical protein JCM14722_06290 [Pseudodesulfovibrio portus]|uniref:Lipid A biosynthesis N-terminal domain-containing protein n=1 Tax=Pseudodesulfovibrio portus TaxID=231439 RepID=A0ABN6RQF0_9BACT|nr:hypothetical protein JCM14722_06290 [Pseudodesulfovibrio portus]